MMQQRQRRKNDTNKRDEESAHQQRPQYQRSNSASKDTRRSPAQYVVLMMPLLLFTAFALFTTRVVNTGTNHSQDARILPQRRNSVQEEQTVPREPTSVQPPPHVRKPAPANTASDDVEYHIVFSTGCTLYQDWQSYLFFHHALSSGQVGTVTRIVSGCANVTMEAELQAIFDEEIAVMSPHFQLHFTPDYSRLREGYKFVYFNKPFGMKHWLEHKLGFPGQPINENAIVVLLDPDQLLMRPFANNDFSNTVWKFANGPYTKIEHGKPMGQLYGFGLQWKDKVNMTAMGYPNSPVDKLSRTDARAGYILGPPYIATARDMYRIVKRWTEFAVPVHEQYPFLLAEMFAYCLAAAHEELPHQTAASFMISDVFTGGAEGWSYIDKLPDAEVCEQKSPEELPNVLHFCQRYGLQDYFFGKRRIPKDIFSCESSLFSEPSGDLVGQTVAYFPNNKVKDWGGVNAKRNLFATCYLLKALNQAATYYKQHHCDSSSPVYEKTLHLVEKPHASARES